MGHLTTAIPLSIPKTRTQASLSDIASSPTRENMVSGVVGMSAGKEGPPFTVTLPRIILFSDTEAAGETDSVEVIDSVKKGEGDLLYYEKPEKWYKKACAVQ